VFTDALSFDISLASKPDAVVGLEFGIISGLVSAQNQKDENENSNVAEANPFGEPSKRLVVIIVSNLQLYIFLLMFGKSRIIN
jgi:hypothetical protein